MHKFGDLACILITIYEGATEHEVHGPQGPNYSPAHILRRDDKIGNNEIYVKD